MKADLKAQWVKALRSGRYRQTTGRLMDGAQRNCCLGVLCRTARVQRELWEREAFLTDIEANDGTLAAALGLTAAQEEVLADKNDSGLTFREIANYIEANL